MSHLPWAIVGTVGIATVWYCLLALALAFVFYPGIGCPACVFFNNGDQTPGFIDAFVLGHGALAPLWWPAWLRAWRLLLRCTIWLPPSVASHMLTRLPTRACPQA